MSWVGGRNSKVEGEIMLLGNTRNNTENNSLGSASIRDVYQRSWLNNLAMTAWKTSVLTLRLMSLLAAGEMEDQVQQASFGTITFPVNQILVISPTAAYIQDSLYSASGKVEKSRQTGQLEG